MFLMILVVQNLDKAIDHKALHDTFSSFGLILSCKIATDAGIGVASEARLCGSRVLSGRPLWLSETLCWMSAGMEGFPAWAKKLGWCGEYW